MNSARLRTGRSLRTIRTRGNSDTRLTGSKSVSALYANRSYKTCIWASVPLPPKRKTEPSGAARATRIAPVIPPATPTFSTTICWPSTSLRWVANKRAMTSVPPPATNGTTMVTGRVGQFCARPLCETNGIANAPATLCNDLRLVNITISLCSSNTRTECLGTNLAAVVPAHPRLRGDRGTQNHQGFGHRWPRHMALLRRMGPRLRGDDSGESLLQSGGDSNSAHLAVAPPSYLKCCRSGGVWFLRAGIKRPSAPRK